MSVSTILSRSVKMALGEGASQAEAFASDDDYYGNTIEDSRVSLGARRHRFGIGLRVLLNSSAGNRMGLSFTEDFSDEGLRRAVRFALSVARVSAEFPSYSFPFSPVPNSGSFSDRVLTRLEPDDTAELADRLAGIKDRYKGIGSMLGLLRMGVTRRWVTNSLGVEASSDSSLFITEIHATSDKGRKSVGVNVVYSGKYDPWLAERCAESAIDWAQVKSERAPETFRGQFPVILLPRAVSQLLLWGVLDFFRADLSTSTSLRAGVGDLVCSPSVTIKDDPLMPEGICSRLFDDEGCAARKNILVENGTTRMLMHNSLTALRDKCENTGFAFRGDYTGEDPPYKLMPSIGPSNIVVEVRDKSLDIEELQRDLTRGIIIREVLPFRMDYGGKFVASFVDGLLFDAKDSRRPVGRGTLSGNLADISKKVLAAGGESLEELAPGYTTAAPTVVTPSVAVAGLTVLV